MPISRTYYTIQEVSALLAVSDKTVRRWILTGHLEAVRIGGTTRIHRSELERLRIIR